MYISGIGGQGVQLVAKVLALAAIQENRHAMLNGFYGHEMRGGVSLSTVVLGDGPLKSLPVAAKVDAAVVLHDHFWERHRGRLRDNALVVAEATIAERLHLMPGHRRVSVPASRIALEVGNPMTMGLALLAAFTSITGVVETQSLMAAMRSVVPAHRRQHVEYNERAILAGSSSVQARSEFLVRQDPGQRATA